MTPGHERGRPRQESGPVYSTPSKSTHPGDERLAVTPAQIEQYQLPTRPTKGTDTRSSGFEGESVEVDALPPSVLRQIVGDAIKAHINRVALELTMSVEDSERDVLGRLVGGVR